MNFEKLKLQLEQTKTFTIAQMKSRYRNSVAGFIWVTLSPVIILSVQSFVFKQILKLNIENYFLYLLSGLIPWIIITQGIDVAIPTILNNREILKNFLFSPFILINSLLFDHMLNMIFTLLVALFIGLLIEGSLPFTILLYPISFVGLLFGMWGMSHLLSALHVLFRDTRFIVTFFHNILFFLTPIFYSINDVPQYAQTFIKINPYYIMIRPLRDIMWNFQVETYLINLSVAILVGGSILVFSIFFVNKFRNKIYARL